TEIHNPAAASALRLVKQEEEQDEDDDERNESSEERYPSTCFRCFQKIYRCVCCCSDFVDIIQQRFVGLRNIRDKRFAFLIAFHLTSHFINELVRLDGCGNDFPFFQRNFKLVIRDRLRFRIWIVQ